jgi:hypothetical protein
LLAWSSECCDDLSTQATGIRPAGREGKGGRKEKGKKGKGKEKKRKEKGKSLRSPVKKSDGPT